MNLAAVYAMLLREIPDDDILLAIFFDLRTKGFWFTDDLDRRAALLRTAEAAVHRCAKQWTLSPNETESDADCMPIRAEQQQARATIERMVRIFGARVVEQPEVSKLRK